MSVETCLYKIVRRDTGESVKEGLSQDIAEQLVSAFPKTYRAVRMDVVDLCQEGASQGLEKSSILNDIGGTRKNEISGIFGNNTQTDPPRDSSATANKPMHPALMAAIAVIACLILIPLFTGFIFPIIAAVIWYGAPFVIIAVVALIVWFKFGTK